MAPPTSPGLLPMRLLASETVPLIPVLPLPHVAAPRLPPPHGPATTQPPLLKAVTDGLPMLLPTASPGLLPLRLLASETVPLIPVIPFPQVTAPRPPFQPGVGTT